MVITRRWLECRETDDHQGTTVMERRMREIMDGNDIPAQISSSQLASPREY